MRSIATGHRGRSPRLARACLPLLGLALAACAPSAVGTNQQLGWLEPASQKRLGVEQAQYRHVVRFATDSTEISGAERDRLLAFLAAAEPRRGDALRLEGHADERASETYNLELAARRTESVERLLDELGLGRVRVVRTAYGEAAPADPGGTAEAWRANRRVELVLERHVVVLPACPDWSRKSGTDFANLPHSNQGCATETNLGLMIAEPRDLVQGRSLDPADGTREAEAIVRYRDGDVNAINPETID